MSKTTRRRWKSAELKVAKFWGMVRAHFQAFDTMGHPLITVEVKSRVKPIRSIELFMQQAIAEAPEGKTPVVQLHIKGTRFEEDLVILRACDLRQFIGIGGYWKGPFPEGVRYAGDEIRRRQASP